MFYVHKRFVPVGYSRTVADYIKEKLGRPDINLMSKVGYDEATEAAIYSCLCKTMDWKTFNKVDPDHDTIIMAPALSNSWTLITEDQGR